MYLTLDTQVSECCCLGAFFYNRLGLGIFFFTIKRAIHVHFCVGAVCFKPFEGFPISEHNFLILWYFRLRTCLSLNVYLLEALMKGGRYYPVVMDPWPP